MAGVGEIWRDYLNNKYWGEIMDYDALFEQCLKKKELGIPIPLDILVKLYNPWGMTQSIDQDIDIYACKYCTWEGPRDDNHECTKNKILTEEQYREFKKIHDKNEEWQKKQKWEKMKTSPKVVLCSILECENPAVKYRILDEEIKIPGQEGNKAVKIPFCEVHDTSYNEEYHFNEERYLLAVK